jgi:hypothetical protein
MLVFRHELKEFLQANLDRAFMTCNAHACPVFEFLKFKEPNFVGSVTAKRIRRYSADVGVEVNETRPWLKAFIIHCDLHGVRDLREGSNPQPITGREALALLDGVPF